MKANQVNARVSTRTEGIALFEGAFDKPVVGLFHESEPSSDGGIALLAAAAKRTGLFEAMAPLIADPRDHTVL